MSNSDHELRRLLIRFREDVLISSYLGTARDEGLLRRQMINAILEHRPHSMIEIIILLPRDLIRHTDFQQIRDCGDEVGAIVEAFDERQRRLAGQISWI